MILPHNDHTEAVLGIDLGSGSLKAVLTDLSGNPLGQAKVAYPTQMPLPGWAQQNPDDWGRALETAMQTLRDENSFDFRRIRCIGFCGAAHVPVLLDKKDRPTYPAILWNDCRSGQEVAWLEKNNENSIVKLTANRPGCAWTLPQLFWIRQHVPEAIEQTVTFLTLKDYLVYLLTGEKICDPGSASATLLYDYETQQWSGELFEHTGLSKSTLPDIVPSDQIVGRTTDAAARFGFVSGTPVVCGCLDSVSEMIALGATRENDTVIRLGTAAALLTLQRNVHYTQGMFTYPFPFDHLAIKQAGTSSCGKSMDWIREILSATPSEFESISTIPCGSEGVLFHPFLQGERCPYDNPDLRGSFIGLSASHRREHLLRAVLEGVCFSLRDCINSVRKRINIPDQIRVIGGGVKCPLWMSILADVLDIPLIPNRDGDSAFGAAILAARAIGLNFEETLPTASSTEVVRPDKHSVGQYNAIFDEYKYLAETLNRYYDKYGVPY